MIEPFITQSTQVQSIIKGFNLTKSLFVSSILVGNLHIGKKTLIRYLFPNAIYADGSNQANIEQLLEHQEELVIINFEKLSNFESLNFENKRIIAIANYISNEKIIDSLFAFIYRMPSLKERPEDIELLTEHFTKEVKSNLMIDGALSIDRDKLDLSSNTRSLKRSIYQQAFSSGCDSRDIQKILFHYLFENMGGESDYKTYLPLYEKPLIEAGLKKFGSQLKLSDKLGINRNTLRKKIYELGID